MSQTVKHCKSITSRKEVHCVGLRTSYLMFKAFLKGMGRGH